MNSFVYHHSLYMVFIPSYTWFRIPSLVTRGFVCHCIHAFVHHHMHGFVCHRSLHMVLYIIVYVLHGFVYHCVHGFVRHRSLHMALYTIVYMVLYTITRYTCFRTPFYTWFSTPPLVMHGLVYHLYMVLYTIVYVLYAITRYTWFCIPSYTWCRTSYTCFFIPSFVTKGFTIVLLQKVSFSLCNVNPESCKRACEGQAYIPLLIVHDTSFKYMTDPVVNSYHASHKPVVFTTQGVT